MNYIKNFPSTWQFLPLKDLVSQDGIFVDGNWVESKDQDPNGDVRLIQLADLGDGYYRNRSDRFMIYEKALALRCTFLQAGDILVARMPDPLGRACIFPGDPKLSVTVVDVCIIRTPKVNHKWLMYTINSPQFRSSIESKQSGSTRKRISRTNLANLYLPVPSIPEQECIVAKIEELFTQLDAGTAALKRVQAGLKRYKASVLKAAVEGRLVPQDPNDEPAAEMLRRLGKKSLEGEDLPPLPQGWCWTRIGDIGKVKGGKRLPAGHNYANEPTPHSYLRVVDFKEFSICTDNLKFITPDTHKRIKNYVINKEDLYISIAGSIGKVGVIPHQLDGANLTENAAKITDLQIIQNKYLVYVLASSIGREQISSSTISTNQPKLALFRIEKIMIPLPPINEQLKIYQAIEERLTLAIKIEKDVDDLISRTSKLRQSVLKQAFEGKL